MKTLDLRKIDYKDYKKIEYETDNKDTLEQDIIRLYNFLKTHFTTKENEFILLKVLNTRKSENDDWCKKSDEYILTDDFENFRNFILKYKKSDKRVFDIFYSVFSMDRFKMKESYKNYYFLCTKDNASSTSILIADFDGITYKDYLETIKPTFLNRGIETTDIWSGHGIHSIIMLKENCTDKDVLKKWIITLQNAGLTPDVACKDAGRIMRCPFFNNTKKKYDVFTRAEIICNTNKKYDLRDIFNRFNQNYDDFKIEEKIKNIGETRKRQKVNKKDLKVKLLEDNELESYYNIDLNQFPDGVKNMLKGLRPGFSNMQVYFLTIYLKKFFEKDEIINILNKLEAINGNSWNSWGMEDEVNRFYEYAGISKFDFLQLQLEFGKLGIEKENEVKITRDFFKYDAKEIQLYLGFKRMNITSCKGYELQQLTGIAKSTVYNCCKGNLVEKRGLFYNIKDIETNDDNGFIILDREKMTKICYENADAIKIYLYLKFRQQKQREIKIKKENIAKEIGYTRQTVSKYLRLLEKKNMISIKRGHYLEEENKRITDTYIVY